jgi:uncharacterized membrane protein
MQTEYPPASGSAIFRVLVCFPIACFCGALVTDIIYAATADFVWADFSTWLLATGIILGGIAALIGIIDFLANRRARPVGPVWLVAVGSIVVLVLALFDNLVHSRDAWTCVVPVGLALSAVTVIVTLITAWFGAARVYRPVLAIPYSGARP